MLEDDWKTKSCSDSGAGSWRPVLPFTAIRLALVVSEPQALPEHGVTVVFVELPNTKIELLEVLGENSPLRPSLSAIRPAAFIMSATRLMTFLQPATS